MILVTTHLGYGAPNKQDTFEAHGSPLGAQETRLTKENLGWPEEPPFFVPEKALAKFRQAVTKGKEAENKWQALYHAYAQDFPDLGRELDDLIAGRLPAGWDQDIPVFPTDEKGMATRKASNKVLTAIAPRLPGLIGGSADLNPSTYTTLTDMGDFEYPSRLDANIQGSSGGKFSYAGRNIHFGVREHAMASILNGIAAHGALLPFGATFLIFSDYARPAMRLAALMGLHVIYVFTHDSIGLGQDGPTHQPVEQLANLRAIPNFMLIRPADSNETVIAWKIAVEANNQPVALVFSRQNLPTFDRTKFASAEGTRKGAYVLIDAPNGNQPDVILIATGSEVHLAVEAREKLLEQKVFARVVSMPSWELFKTQPRSYREGVLITRGKKTGFDRSRSGPRLARIRR